MASDSDTSFNTSDEKDYNDETTEDQDSTHTSDIDFVVQDSDVDRSSESFVPSESSASSSAQGSRHSSFPTQSSGTSSSPSDGPSNISAEDEEFELNLFPSFGGFRVDNDPPPAVEQQEKTNDYN